MSPLHSLKLCSTLTIEHTPLSVTLLQLYCATWYVQPHTHTPCESLGTTKQNIAAQSVLPHVGNLGFFRFYEAMPGVDLRTPLA